MSPIARLCEISLSHTPTPTRALLYFGATVVMPPALWSCHPHCGHVTRTVGMSPALWSCHPHSTGHARTDRVQLYLDSRSQSLFETVME